MNLRQQQAAATRKQLLKAAIELVAERGLTGFTFSDVAVQSGKSRNLAFHHFKSMDVLVAATVEELLCYTPPASAPSGDLEAFINTVRISLRTTLKDESRTRAIYAALGAVHRDAPSRLRAAAAYQAAHKTIAARLQAVGDAGNLAEGVDVGLQAYAILSLIRGAVFIVLAGVDELDPAALADEVGASLARALAPTPRERDKEEQAPTPIAAVASMPEGDRSSLIETGDGNADENKAPAHLEDDAEFQQGPVHPTSPKETFEERIQRIAALSRKKSEERAAVEAALPLSSFGIDVKR